MTESVVDITSTSTSRALELLRLKSFDNDEALIESELEPLFHALDAHALRGDTNDGTLDTVIVPGLRRILRKPRKHSLDVRRCVFDIMLRVWCTGLVDDRGCAIVDAVDPFCRRAKWSISTSIFAVLITQCEMIELFHDALNNAEIFAKIAMMKALFASETPRDVVEQLTLSTSTAKEVKNANTDTQTVVKTDNEDRIAQMRVAFTAPKVSKQEEFLQELLACDSREKAAKVMQNVPGSSVHFDILCSDRFILLRKLIQTHDDEQLAEIERDLIALLNRITSSANANVSSRMATNLANELVWPMLVNPVLTSQRLIQTAVAHPLQASIIIAALHVSPSLARYRSSSVVPPYLLAAFADFLRNIPSDFVGTKASDALSFLCDALFKRTNGNTSVLDLREGLLYVVLPMLTPTFLSDASSSDSLHGSYFALDALKSIVSVTNNQVQVDIVAKTFPEGILLALCHVIDWSRKHRLTATQVMASTLLSQLCKGLGGLYETHPLSEYDLEAFQEADHMAAISIEWDTRVRMDSVMSLARVDLALRPIPPSLQTGAISSLMVDVLKLYGADAGDDILVELLQALQGIVGGNLAEFRQSLLVACVVVLPRISLGEFERISQVGIPTVLTMHGVVHDDAPVSSLVLDILARVVIFSANHAPESAFVMCRHFTHLASSLVSEAKETFELNKTSAAMVRNTFHCACHVLRHLPHSRERNSLEVLLISSALVSLQTLNASRAHKHWASTLVRGLPHASVAKKQLEGALLA